jgi:hypothetical protein
MKNVLLSIVLFVGLLGIGTEGGRMSGVAIEELEKYSLSTRLDESALAAATVITLRAPIDLVTGETTQLRINPGGGTEETVTVSSVQDKEATLSSGLSSAHLAGELVIRLNNAEAELFVPVNGTYDTNASAAIARTDTDAEGYPMLDNVPSYAFGDFHVPKDYLSGGELDVILISNASGNVYGKLTADFAAKTETWNTHTVNSGFSAQGLTALKLSRELYEFTLTGLAAGDYVAITFLRQGDHASDTVGNTVYIRGFIFTYTAIK